jgi:hypothetical protein
MIENIHDLRIENIHDLQRRRRRRRRRRFSMLNIRMSRSPRFPGT